MDVSEIISDIKQYLELYRSEGNQNIEDHVEILPQRHKTNSLLHYKQELHYMKSSSPGDDVYQLLGSIIEHCDDEVLEELLIEYGEDSVLGVLIKKKRVLEYSTVSCDPEIIKTLLEKKLSSAHKDNPFYETVIEYMKKIGFENDADFYNYIGMPRQLFAKIRDGSNNYRKKTVLWIIVGLKANYAQADDLIRKAGYSFRKNDMRDVILSYIFRNTKYDLKMVNEILDYFGLEPFC